MPDTSPAKQKRAKSREGSSEAGDPIAIRERSRIPAKMRGVCVGEHGARVRYVVLAELVLLLLPITMA